MIQSTIVINMTKAREIKRDIFRKERAPILADLDVQYMRAIEAGNTPLQQEIAQKKQALRDVTQDPAIESAVTPEELKAFVPEALL